MPGVPVGRTGDGSVSVSLSVQLSGTLSTSRGPFTVPVSSLRDMNIACLDDVGIEYRSCVS